MKIRNLFLAGAVAFSLAACNSSEKKADNTDHAHDDENHVHTTASFAVDTENSVVYWKGTMIGLYAHTGTVNVSEGTLSMEDGMIKEGSFVVDLNTMLTNDEDALYKAAPREKLIEHLQAPDFFEVENFPTATFVVKSHEGNMLKGDLTIKGVTNEASVENVNMSEEEGVLKAKGDLVFDRQAFNVTWSHPVKERVLSDDIELNIELSANSI